MDRLRGFRVHAGRKVEEERTSFLANNADGSEGGCNRWRRDETHCRQIQRVSVFFFVAAAGAAPLPVSFPAKGGRNVCWPERAGALPHSSKTVPAAWAVLPLRFERKVWSSRPSAFLARWSA